MLKVKQEILYNSFCNTELTESLNKERNMSKLQIEQKVKDGRTDAKNGQR